MKKIKYLIILFIGVTFYSCTEDVYNLWSDPTTRLSFKFIKDVDSVSTSTFVYDTEIVQKDTFMIAVYTSGFTSNQDRAFIVEQLDPLKETAKKAEAGIHFLGFDHPEVVKHLVIKAGEVKAEIPIIMLRDKSLAKNEVELRIRIKENEHFITGIEKDKEKRLIFADILQKPSTWSTAMDKYYLGVWGPEKHRFMINTLPDEKINDDFFTKIYGPKGDIGLLKYYIGVLKAELIKENERRKENKLDILREAPKAGQTVGDPVKFI